MEFNDQMKASFMKVFRIEVKCFCGKSVHMQELDKERNLWILSALFNWWHGCQGGAGGRLKRFSASIRMEASRGRRGIGNRGMSYHLPSQEASLIRLAKEVQEKSRKDGHS